MILVLGLGNVLLTDDGIGVHATVDLAAQQDEQTGESAFRVRDGGTIGLALLPDIEAANGLIAVDAMALGEKPGTVRVFEGEAMDARLRGRRTSVHELALADLMDASALIGRKPERRALVGIQPHSLGWGLEPTPDVAAAIPQVHAAVGALVERWRS